MVNASLPRCGLPWDIRNVKPLSAPVHEKGVRGRGRENSESRIVELTNRSAVDISAAPPDFSPGEHQSHKTPTWPSSSELFLSFGSDRGLPKFRSPARALVASNMAQSKAPLTQRECYRVVICYSVQRNRRDKYVSANADVLSEFWWAGKKYTDRRKKFKSGVDVQNGLL